MLVFFFATLCTFLSTLIISDEQGFGNLCGYMGKGTVGTGRGKNL